MAKLEHKPTRLEGFRLSEDLELDKPKPTEGKPGDWLLKDHNGKLYILTHEDVTELYKPLDDEARRMLEAEEWPPLRG